MNTTAKKPCRGQAPTRKRRPPWSDPGRLIVSFILQNNATSENR